MAAVNQDTTSNIKNLECLGNLITDSGASKLDESTATSREKDGSNKKLDRQRTRIKKKKEADT